MFSYRRSAVVAPRCAAESGGAYETNPLAEMAEVAAEYEAAKRRMLEVWRDVSDWGGTLAATGLSQSEWLTLTARLSGADEYRLGLLTRRLPALPVTAGLLADGQLTFDQAATICAGTTRLSGQRLAEVEKVAAEEAADRNRRGDSPDIAAEVDLLVQRVRQPAAQERMERRTVDGARVWGQQDLDGGGRINADLDAAGYATVWSAIEDAAGVPSPDQPRPRQRAEGLVALGRAWLAGPTQPDDTIDGNDGGTRLGAARARPTITVKIDTTSASASAFAAQWRSAGGQRAPMLTARMADILACDADLLTAITDGARPLAELTRQSTLPAAVRRQVLLRDLGCRWPGCTAPPWQCDVHHLVHRADGGDHDVDNLAALCRRHHTRLHGTHWHASLDGRTGRFELRRSPTGPVHHTTFPHDHIPGTAPPEVAQIR